MSKFATKTLLPGYLREEQERIEKIAKEYGLDFFPTSFEMLDYDQMNEVAAYGGFPNRYPHWRFGMEYEQLSKSYEYGLSKIYEMVINNNPSYAYLLEGNSLTEQRLVMAHVLGHVDFFKNNFSFRTTDLDAHGNLTDPMRRSEPFNPQRKWIDKMANNGQRVRRHIDRHGVNKVEEFIDFCLSIENLIDPWRPFTPQVPRDDRSEDAAPVEVPRLKTSRSYMDKYINPDDYIEEQRRKLQAQAEKEKRFPERPQRDVLAFLLENAPLERWERDVLEVVREEAYYFTPQIQTKIANEGWACLDPRTLVFTDKGVLTMKDLVEGNASTVSDGERERRVYDQNIIRGHETVTVKTRRGLTLTGSNNHRILMPDGETWRRLDELAVGDKVAISGGRGLWAQEEVRFPPASRASSPHAGLKPGAVTCAPGNGEFKPHRRGAPREKTPGLVSAEPAKAGLIVSKSGTHVPAPGFNPAYGRHSVRGGYRETSAAVARAPYRENHEEPAPLAVGETFPERMSEELAELVGYVLAAGRFTREIVSVSTARGHLLARLARLIVPLFGAFTSLEISDVGHLAVCRSERVVRFLRQQLGLPGPIPEAILRSPEPVVRSFLLAYARGVGAVEGGALLLSGEPKHLEQIQLLLLNFGLLSALLGPQRGTLRVDDATAFAARIGSVAGGSFEESPAGASSDRHLPASAPGFNPACADATGADATRGEPMCWTDEVVAVERGRGDVYDISVEETHRYAAGGFINHNSFWHSKMMTEKVADANDIIEYADRNAGVMATSGGRLNPYKLGVEIYRSIEERWNRGQFGRDWEECGSYEERAHWDLRLGLGRQKLFEVRRLYNDVTFIDEFLTLDLARELKLFTFSFSNRNERFEIETREFKKVKDKLLFQLTNGGNPVIVVLDANFENRGELLLRHEHAGLDLRLDYAKETLRALHRMWRRPVAVATILEQKPTLLRYDGVDHSSRPFKL